MKAEEGFTLIELMIVIAVLGILAGVAIPRITGARTKAIDSVLQSTAVSVKSAVETFYSEYGEYPTVTVNNDDELSAFNSPSNGEMTMKLTPSRAVKLVSYSKPTSEDADGSIVLKDKDGKKQITITLSEKNGASVAESTVDYTAPSGK